MPASLKRPSDRTRLSGSGATKDGKRNGKKNSVNCGSIDSKPHGLLSSLRISIPGLPSSHAPPVPDLRWDLPARLSWIEIQKGGGHEQPAARLPGKDRSRTHYHRQKILS